MTNEEIDALLFQQNHGQYPRTMHVEKFGFGALELLAELVKRTPDSRTKPIEDVVNEAIAAGLSTPKGTIEFKRDERANFSGYYEFSSKFRDSDTGGSIEIYQNPARKFRIHMEEAQPTIVLDRSMVEGLITTLNLVLWIMKKNED